MSDAAALLAAIRAAPEDDAPRLVYADWLDEHGQPERAAFIRIQCELARTADPALRRREAELLAEHHDTFAGPRTRPGIRFRFHRGFVAGFGHTGWFHEVRGRSIVRPRLLCFRPDGRVSSEATWYRVEDMVPRLLSAQVPAGDLGTGTYRVEPVDIPMGIEFTCTSAAGSIDFRGFLEGTELHLDVHDHGTGRLTRQHYYHVHIPGFDSFPEA
jgi:uncharacterized protein (TIGR02996 family)